MSPRPIPACGTNAAYQRHLRLKETPCDPCAEAARRYKRDYNKRKSAAKAQGVSLRLVDSPDLPTVRCPICLERTPVEYPHDVVAVRMATVRHMGDPMNARCARLRLGGR